MSPDANNFRCTVDGDGYMFIESTMAATSFLLR